MKKPRVIAVMLAFSLGLAACSSKTETVVDDKERLQNLNKEGFPIVKEKIEVDGFAAKFFASQDWNQLMLWEEYEKMTNIHVNWETVQTDVLEEKRNLMLAGGDYPDMLFATALPKSDMLKYGDQGVIIELNDYIDDYAPHLKRIMEEYPIVAKGLTMPNGKIYGFPAIFDPKFKGMHYGTPWINKNWLDELGLKEPETLDEFYSTLKAFKERDPNVIPYGGVKMDGVIGFLKGAFELNNHGMANKHLDLDPESGKLRFVPTAKNYRKLLEYTNKLYTEGLIDPEIFTIEYHEFTSKGTEGRYGVVNGIDPETLMGLTGYVGTPVLKGISGKKMSTSIGSPLGHTGMFLITDKAKNPEALVRWMDYFYSEEGVKMFFMGFEGVTYNETADGELAYTDDMTNHPDGLNLDQAISQYLTWPGGYYPGIVREKTFKGAEGKPAARANAEKAEPYTISQEDVWPLFNYTPEEQDELSTISNDINTYVEEMTAQFVTGKTSFSKWNDYVKQLDKMGLKRYMEIQEAAYKRYLES